MQDASARWWPASFDFVTGRGAVSAARLHRHLLSVLDRDVPLLTDTHPAHQACARTGAIRREARKLRAAQPHVENVHARHRRLQQWQARFEGVATGHLPDHPGW